MNAKWTRLKKGKKADEEHGERDDVCPADQQIISQGRQ